ncbi:rhodanese-related sulfurtransferase [Sphingomonas sp. NIBR02145]|uniref:oxygen-dependent tRNA uridine(34) hydroxylase TrhO n=1 Tax=Sphingomonas sp. NIBR02145 TaxID=3014784 RepID=UPI0022B4F6CE|nr:rhodanese-related sulfurtransferase [Sphingomonas sp. NIBR02145]WHU04011.1 rhodanese-related sulfurtransferase [Sphingomonas sp. NIBR02145]
MASPDPAAVPGADLPVRVAALYQFTRFPDVESLKAPLLALCEGLGIKGTLLLANEGLNGTIAGSDDAIAQLLDHVRALPGCAGLDVKYSRAAAMPFDRMKVRLKREIVTMGEPDIDPLTDVGHYVAPADWNALIDAPDTIVIDTRNAYEVALGTFEGAIDPETRSFREFPEWFRKFRAAREADGPMPRVAMFCTGGIRCEKSTAFLKAEGIDEVYHLKGGILAYLEQVPPEQSRWQGECFVFDQRITVDHALQPRNRSLCPRCQGLIACEDTPCPACDDLAFRDHA